MKAFMVNGGAKAAAEYEIDGSISFPLTYVHQVLATRQFNAFTIYFFIPFF